MIICWKYYEWWSIVWSLSVVKHNLSCIKPFLNKHLEIEVETRLEKGRSSDVIVETAREEDVDLIVMGSRGMGDIVGFLGSTSRHVVEACTKPILFVK